MNDDEQEPLLSRLKAIADESRLRIVGLLSERERGVEELAELLQLRAPTVSHHLSVLRSAGIVEMHREGTKHVHRLAPHALASLGAALATPRGKTLAVSASPASDRRHVLGHAEPERLKKLPSRKKKRLAALKWVVEHLEPNVGYDEPSMREELLRLHDDVDTLRRELLAAKLLRRENGLYRRSPGV